jgi:ADP-ribose diphosphatase
MANTPTILNKTTIAKSRLFRIESLDIQFSNGEQRNYERLARGNSSGGAVLIVPMLDIPLAYIVTK